MPLLPIQLSNTNIKSTDGLLFNLIGSVNATGSGNNSYSLTDKNTFEGFYYYRLKIADKNGGFTYSNILKLYQYGNHPISVFPNPAKDKVTISGLSGKGTLTLMNAEGKTLQLIPLTAQTITIDVDSYAAGSYLLKYQVVEKVTYHRLIK
ncbi:MAG: T9SS type A sorting domain-containing protein [Ginsengibacter sp.]